MNFTKDDKLALLGLSIIVFGLMIVAGTYFGIAGLIFVQTFAIIFIVAVFLSSSRKIRKQISKSQRDTESYFALYSTVKFDKPLPPLGGHAMTPFGAKNLTSLVLAEKPNTVVEYGSGVSTLIVAYCLKQLGSGKIISYDHESLYAGKSQDLIDEHEINEYAEVVYAPLVEKEISGERWLWYDVSKRELPVTIDLLIVDGPPRKIQKRSRYPALNSIQSRLKPGSLIVLDDSDRVEEQEIIKAWQNQLPNLQVIPSLSMFGVTVFRVS